jgi:hypothetical protein
MEATVKAHDGDVQMIDSSIVWAHQYAINFDRFEPVLIAANVVF